MEKSLFRATGRGARDSVVGLLRRTAYAEGGARGDAWSVIGSSAELCASTGRADRIATGRATWARTCAWTRGWWWATWQTWQVAEESESWWCQRPTEVAKRSTAIAAQAANRLRLPCCKLRP